MFAGGLHTKLRCNLPKHFPYPANKTHDIEDFPPSVPLKGKAKALGDIGGMNNGYVVASIPHINHASLLYSGKDYPRRISPCPEHKRRTYYGCDDVIITQQHLLPHEF